MSPVAVKFCGLTRESDAAWAGSLGAAFVGVIFAGGPRNLGHARARDVLEAAGTGPKKVGVFGVDFCEQLACLPSAMSLDVVQLHADPSAADVHAVRRLFPGLVWAAVRIAGAAMPPHTAELFDAADAVLFDPRVPGRLGGTGATLPWGEIGPGLEPLRAGRQIVLAGGLTAENVQRAIDAVAPDVVDVSSGVESAPGIKDHTRMTAFVEAVRRST